MADTRTGAAAPILPATLAASPPDPDDHGTRAPGLAARAFGLDAGKRLRARSPLVHGGGGQLGGASCGAGCCG